MIRALSLSFAVAIVAPLPSHAPAPADDSLVSVAWLAQHANDRDIVILQVGPTAEYHKGHIPNARLVDPTNGNDFEHHGDAAAMMDMNALPTAAELRERMQAFGIGDQSHVVVVPGVAATKAITASTRSIFLLRYAGIAHVSLLDGGIDAWKAAGKSLSTAAPTIAAASYSAKVQPDVGVDYQFVDAHLKAPHLRIIDAREPVYYESTKAEMGMAPGHVPGAKNIPFNSVVDEKGFYLQPDALVAKFRAAGVQPGDSVIVYCHVGIQATAVVFAARSVGIPARMYVGSFHDWTAHKLPTEYQKP